MSLCHVCACQGVAMVDATKCCIGATWLLFLIKGAQTQYFCFKSGRKQPKNSKADCMKFTQVRKESVRILQEGKKVFPTLFSLPQGKYRPLILTDLVLYGCSIQTAAGIVQWIYNRRRLVFATSVLTEALLVAVGLGNHQMSLLFSILHF